MKPLRHVDREIRPRYGDVCDWGAQRRVIARTQDESILLFMVESHTTPVGARGFGREYCPARLVLFDRYRGPSGRADWIDLQDGRVSQSDLLTHAPKIDAAFGMAVTGLIDLRRTLIVPNRAAPR